MILLLVMNLHEMQMPVMWQIDCFSPICNAVHIAKIVGQFILSCSPACMQSGTLKHLVQLVC